MKMSSLSMLVFAAYLATLALAFLLFPNPFITLFGFAPTHEVWIRILGYLLGVMAFFFVMAVREEATHFYRWTVYARFCVLPLFALLVWSGLGPAILLLFAAFELGCALWTGYALKRERADFAAD